MRALRYAFDEAFASLWRGRQAGVLSTFVIAMALFVLGAFLLFTSNLERLGTEWSRAAELSIYLSDQASEADRTALEAALRGNNAVSDFAYVSKDEALQRFKTTFADLAGAVDSLQSNPLPTSYDVRLKPAAAADVDKLAGTLRGAQGVEDVRYDRQWLDRLTSAVTIVRGVGLVLGAVLTVAAALTVANVVRLALHARRDELEIMQLVGAPQSYIRGPFVAEGLLQGGVGAALALAALAALFLAVRGRYLAPLALTMNLSSVGFLSPELCLLLLVGGMLVGCVGGMVAAMGRV